MNNDRKQLIPDLRFPEFVDDGEWKNKELGEYLDYIQPTNYLVNSTSYDDSYETPVLTAGKTFILGYTDETTGIFAENLPIIIFDDFTTAVQYVDFPFKAKSSAMKILLPKGDANIKFFYESIANISYVSAAHQRHWISIFSKIEVPVPKNNIEQQKIASCLSSLDELIIAQKEKLELLKNHKKGLMQNLFPQEGETVPKFRFPEFENDGEWVEKKLGEICDVRDGTHDSPKYISRGYPLITSKNLMSDGSMDFFNVNYITEDDYNQINRRSKVNIGDILFGMIGTIGNPVVVKKEGFAIKNVALIKSKGTLNQIFLVYQLESDFIEQQFARVNAGGILKFIALGIIRNLKIIISSPEEQEKIAACLSSLDELISSQKDKIENLKLHKKGLMQGLFPKMID